MITNSIDYLNTISLPVGQAPARTPKSTLDQTDFLKLLSIQMSNQDPMNPTQDTEFVAQMASFTSLEQMKILVDSTRWTNTVSLIGQHVTLNTVDPVTKMNVRVTGTVDEVVLRENKPFVVINGEAYDASKISQVTTPPPALPDEPSAENPAA